MTMTEMKTVINQKKTCFREGDREILKTIMERLKREIHKAKHKDNIESFMPNQMSERHEDRNGMETQ